VKPLDATAIPVDTSDEQLVARAQEGSSEAFAVLFRRYRPAIARYAGRLLGDDARAEDVVQEVFLSALRGIDGLDRPTGFKPWLYRIAHNACVDHMRRNRRAEEVSIDAAVLAPAEEIRLFRQAPSTHAALSQKEDFKNLREAFRGLPPSQSEVLVMRELEGLSYDEIAARMGITRASVESMLFRARQGLRDEYGEIATGARCERMQPVMARMAEGVGGLRDRRALARHVRNCASCRRDAYAMGLGGLALEAPVTGLRGRLSRVASLLPLPWLIHRRGDDPSAASSAGGGGGSLTAHAQTAITQLSSTMSVSADHAATGIQKAVAVVAAVAVVGGGGIVASKTGTRGELPLKPESTVTPARADIGAAVPAALLPIAARGGEPVAAGVPGAAAHGSPPAGGPPTAVMPLLAPLPGGVPGALGAPSTPTALGSPADPTTTAPGADGAPGSSTPDTTSDGGASTPAAEGPSSAGTGAGDDQSGSGGSATGGDTGSSSGDSDTTGGTSGGTTGGGGSAGGSSGGGSATGTSNDPCDLPPGLDKKGKIPPGHLKKCPALGAANAPAP
jgi:RNA polymerase sigma factor (sigma-70 family)